MVAKRCLIAFKTQAPQQIPEVHDGTQSPSLSPRSQIDSEQPISKLSLEPPMSDTRHLYCLRALVSLAKLFAEVTSRTGLTSSAPRKGHVAPIHMPTKLHHIR